MTSDQYNWVQSIYFVSHRHQLSTYETSKHSFVLQIAYIVFEVPSNLLLKEMTPRLWQSRIIISWGIVLACHAAVQNKDSYYALRFLLGMVRSAVADFVDRH